MADNALYRVRGVPGVAWAVRLYKGLARAQFHEGNFKQFIVLGLDDDTFVGAPQEMIHRAAHHSAAAPQGEGMVFREGALALQSRHHGDLEEVRQLDQLGRGLRIAEADLVAWFSGNEALSGCAGNVNWKMAP